MSLALRKLEEHLFDVLSIRNVAGIVWHHDMESETMVFSVFYEIEDDVIDLPVDQQDSALEEFINTNGSFQKTCRHFIRCIVHGVRVVSRSIS